MSLKTRLLASISFYIISRFLLRQSVLTDRRLPATPSSTALFRYMGHVTLLRGSCNTVTWLV